MIPFSSENQLKKEIPFYDVSVKAGFPSPAEDYITKKLDLHDLVVYNPTATFFIRVSGDSMVDATIFDGDVLIIDRSLPVVTGKIILAFLDGEFTVKTYVKTASGVRLVAANPAYKDIIIQPETDFRVWGVVTHTIHKMH